MNVGSFSDSSLNGLSPIFKGNRLKLKFFQVGANFGGKKDGEGGGFQVGGMDGWGGWMG